MTNELEKQFFNTFGIKPKLVESCTKPRHKCSERFAKDCSECPRAWRKYPQITDRILLELICIKNKELISIVQVKGKSLEELKSYILQICIKGYTKYSNSSLSAYRELADNFKHQVRTLFKEG